MTTNQAVIMARYRELISIRVAMKRNQHAGTQLANAERSILNRITQLEKGHHGRH